MDDIMEFLLHYVWQHRLWTGCAEQLTTPDGHTVEVVDPGVHNLQAGPDFFNAKVRIDGTLWAGNVEIHTRSSDWFRHHHETDAAYNNVILHVVAVNDSEVVTAGGKQPPQVRSSVYRRPSKPTTANCLPRKPIRRATASSRMCRPSRFAPG